MTRYLHHLAARARGSLETIRPRVPSRFEPWPDAADPGAEWLADAVTSTDAPPPRSSPQRAQAQPAAEPAAAAQRAQPVRRAEAPVAAAAVRQSTQSPAPDPAPAPPAPVVHTAQPVEAPPRAATAPVPAPQASPDAAPTPVLRAWTPRDEGRAPNRADARASILPGAAAREETVVHVSIGRIDVRALAPMGLPAPRARPPAPVHSLEDWLAGRGRR